MAFQCDFLQNLKNRRQVALLLQDHDLHGEVDNEPHKYPIPPLKLDLVFVHPSDMILLQVPHIQYILQAPLKHHLQQQEVEASSSSGPGGLGDSEREPGPRLISLEAFSQFLSDFGADLDTGSQLRNNFNFTPESIYWDAVRQMQQELKLEV